MNQRIDRYYLYLTWPRYLAQWYAHEMYRLGHYDDEHLPEYRYDCDQEPRMLEPVKTRRGSMERNILEMFLAKQPDAVPEKPDPNATIAIQIPGFLNKPPQTYNYLPPKARHLLEQSVRCHFRAELTKYFNKLGWGINVQGRGGFDNQTMLIEAFMEANGIENTETNMIAIKQTWRRLSWNIDKKKSKNENTGN